MREQHYVFKLEFPSHNLKIFFILLVPVKQHNGRKPFVLGSTLSNSHTSHLPVGDVLVMSKSQSRLGFKSLFELFWRFDLGLYHTYSILTGAIRFAIRLKKYAILFEKDLNRGNIT